MLAKNKTYLKELCLLIYLSFLIVFTLVYFQEEIKNGNFKEILSKKLHIVTKQELLYERSLDAFFEYRNNLLKQKESAVLTNNQQQINQLIENQEKDKSFGVQMPLTYQEIQIKQNKEISFEEILIPEFNKENRTQNTEELSQNFIRNYVLLSRPVVFPKSCPYPSSNLKNNLKNLIGEKDQLVNVNSLQRINYQNLTEIKSSRQLYEQFQINQHQSSVKLSWYLQIMIQPIKESLDQNKIEQFQEQSSEQFENDFEVFEEIQLNLFRNYEQIWYIQDLQVYDKDKDNLRKIQEIGFVEYILDLQNLKIDFGYFIDDQIKFSIADQLICNVSPHAHITLRMVSPFHLDLIKDPYYQKSENSQNLSFVQNIQNSLINSMRIEDLYEQDLSERDDRWHQTLFRLKQASIYKTDLKQDDCVFVPGGWATQINTESSDIFKEKFILKYDYGDSSPWINIALL